MIVCGTSWSRRWVSWFPGEALAAPGNQETSRWDQLVPQTINHGIHFSPVNYLFEIYLFHTINSICFQMLCYSRCVRHVCFGVNGPITAQLSNGPWQRSGIAWSHLLLSFTFPYMNWPITEGENIYDYDGWDITHLLFHADVPIRSLPVGLSYGSLSYAMGVTSMAEGLSLRRVSNLYSVNFREYYVLVAPPPPSPPPPHANACTDHNFVTNTPIKLIFAIAIGSQITRTLLFLASIGKNKMASGGHFV